MDVWVFFKDHWTQRTNFCGRTAEVVRHIKHQITCKDKRREKIYFHARSGRKLVKELWHLVWEGMTNMSGVAMETSKLYPNTWKLFELHIS